ncbi:hypothetical protein MNBD_GAMMA18-1323 [hydrothermal vent metagenome]|uniref:Uncharacterized protein n=1 Tax=hydrothermal vent metagenome TaxID=652676 RepID=A0A3B0ZJW9_9ZZZZ
MSTYKELRKFTPEELLFNEEETRTVLKFIFAETHHKRIDSLPMSDRLREFAQALLVEAIDTSHAIGYVHGLFRSVKNPVKGALKILKSFGKKASQNWFKHASVHDIQSAQVYNFVLDYMGTHFAKFLPDFLANNDEVDKKMGAFLAYKVPTHGIVIRWG